ncbi:citryl-CoA lyase [Arenibaculum pallidiluteum]|uniref:citryl-CoA lyase n=1 Tax=Arenibaculum pallidiluteum TaxID=2812559 RepID=UPI001A96809F|nr:citryl-CoA lyase [Arenibaculum pallidiluteum]
MKIGRQDDPSTSISTSDAHTITVRGQDLCRDLIGKIDFTEYFFLLVTGERPTEMQRFFLNCTLVAIAEHGLVPSVQAARMTYAAAPDALQGAVAAGILGCGSVVLGSSEAAGRFQQEILAEADARGTGIEEAALACLRRLKADRKAVPGFGHPLHKDGDPRTHRLFDLAKEKGVAGRHVEAVETCARLIPEVYGRPLPINISAGIPAVMLDVGFPAAVLKGIPILARTAGLIGHLNEEAQRPIGFVLSYHGGEAIRYDAAGAGSTSGKGSDTP